MAGKLVSKAEVQLHAAPKAKRGRPPKSPVADKATRKQSIAKVSGTGRPVGRPPKVERPHHPGISITLKIPALQKPKNIGANTAAHHLTVPRRRFKWIAFAAVLAVVTTGAASAVVLLPKKPAFKPGAAVQADAGLTAPSYQPLMFADQKPTDQSFDGKRNMVSFTTSFSGARITVSEQALPENFSRDPAALLRTADSINAKQRIDTASGPLFIATNEVGGNQMGVFADKQVLGFIRTDRKMDDTSWKSLVEQLQPVEWPLNN